MLWKTKRIISNTVRASAMSWGWSKTGWLGSSGDSECLKNGTTLLVESRSASAPPRAPRGLAPPSRDRHDPHEAEGEKGSGGGFGDDTYSHRQVGPLRLHDARHTFASLALASGKRVRWVASQLGHANPELTLRVYAHALREEEADLSFLDFGGTKRHPRGPNLRAAAATRKPPRATSRRGLKFLERETGLEPATLSLGTRSTGPKSAETAVGYARAA